ncbi:carbohydrate porin [Enterobacteriaceae bacterium H20N1]|uniref:Carbohydrate porin n=1 Tax=Dryocola boscaweniae TaxID=2925397 RepID=A0A9X2WB12_9ENTR|nr:carbohydrate porin [Dryocola boscaweniae]MCT4703482.1 carbohydrate porin [Dryocola boscaweniae]MCT4720650.1 carbohydrate porin [Dryocola boscaweniae]
MKKLLLVTAISLVCFKTAAEMTFDTAAGQYKLYGDVEFDLDAASSSMPLDYSRRSEYDNDRWDAGGRILLGLDGRRELASGNFAGFRVQPLATMHDGMSLDDAVFYFGQKDGDKNTWSTSIGRFEAYDMFPLNQDTFIQYSGNTANDLYKDGFGYIYMMKEGRGRSNSGGNIMLNKTIDNLYFELNALLEDGVRLFGDESYHNQNLTRKKNTIYLRPVIAWHGSNFSTAVASENNIINNAYGHQDENGKFKDLSRRNGFGWTTTLRADNDITANINVAWMNAQDEKDFTAAANILWDKFEVGYIYAHNKIEKFYTATVNGDDFINSSGKYNINTIHASYRFDNILDMDNFNIYLGSYWSQIKRDSGDLYNGDDNSDNRYGVRVRFKYFF